MVTSVLLVVVDLAADFAAGLDGGLLAGLSVVLVGFGPGVLVLSSSVKLFFSHLDGKHIVGQWRGGEEEGKG